MYSSSPPMGDSPVSRYGQPPLLPPPLPPPPPPTKQNLPLLYYGLVVVGTAAVVLAIYNLIVIKCCTQRPPRRGRPRLVEIAAGGGGGSSQSFEHLSSIKYKKDAASPENGEFECAVCLCTVEDGEEVRRLPSCKHEFHVSCIDMWLYSHSDCPLCRALVAPPVLGGRQEPAASPELEHSRDGLLRGSALLSL